MVCNHLADVIIPGPAVEPLTPHSLMASTLRSPNLIAIPPLAFARIDESEALLIYHLGKSLCGHEGIVHGGIVGTILDDSLARNVSCLEAPEARDDGRINSESNNRLQAFLNLPSKTGVTASLNISYLKPTKTDQV
jgi:acyl-coenzyme A thioesterase PaaI-like protein